jgi:hypothetical protein
MRRRQLNVFTLSFIDAMACGFGAVVLLFFMIVRHAAPQQAQATALQREAEVTRIELELREGRELLARLQSALAATEQRIAETQDLSQRIATSLRSNEEALRTAEETSRERSEALKALKVDVQAIDAEARALRSEAEEAAGGEAARAFVGQGDRQYLTGLRVRGDRVLILLDASASMLDETIVNVIRRRNMPDEQKLASRKWQRALTTVDWLMSQLPVEGRFQVYAFNGGAQPLEGTAGQWLEVKDTDRLDAVAAALRKVVPAGGTSLHNAFAAAAAFDPAPDNLLLVTDGLPTQAESAPVRKTVSSDARLRLFERAARLLPTGMPVNTVLFPMEGDPRATSAYWQLAQFTAGSLVSPAKDWP